RHLDNQRTSGLIESEGRGQVTVHRLDQHAQPATADLATVLELRHHIHGHVDGNGKRQSHVTTVTTDYLAVDADHFAVEVEQRATAVTGIDRHIGLDKGHVVFARQTAALGADDAGGDRAVKTEWRTDGQHPLTNFQL